MTQAKDRADTEQALEEALSEWLALCQDTDTAPGPDHHHRTREAYYRYEALAAALERERS